ncbi:hypothetical protein F5Y10DRAFT_253865 [Nemania abortiva]|nr:hypothetical protein F5Y10DRAFT_253865 [Nemania abortiva]
MVSFTIRDLLLLAFVGSAIALPLNAEKRDPAKDIGIGITFKYPFKAAEGAVDGTTDAAAVEKRGKDAISFSYPIFKAAGGATDTAAVEKRSNDAISFKYPIFKVADGTTDGTVEKRGEEEKRATDTNAISFKYPFVAADGSAEKRATDNNAITFKYPFVAAEKRATDTNAISFKYPFIAADGAVEKREPKSAYADVIAAADPRDILG